MRPVEDYAPLLVGDEENPSKATRKPARQRIAVTVCYCFIMVINGGACGAFGPSLEVFERTTGLSQAVLGGAVMQNRLAKLVGTVVWGYFASRLQKYKPGEEPVLTAHYLMASALLVSGACCAVRSASARCTRRLALVGPFRMLDAHHCSSSACEPTTPLAAGPPRAPYLRCSATLTRAPPSS